MTAKPRVLCAGLATLDLVQRVDEFPGPNEKVAALEADLFAGGPGAGAALAAAALGARARLITALGRHPLGEVVRKELADHGVEVADADPRGEAPPPVSAVSVREGTGERSVVSRNAGDRVAGPAESLLATPGTEVALLDGHYPELAMAVAVYARRHRIPVLLDAGSWKPVLDGLLPMVDIAVCSADFRAPGTTDPTGQGPALMDRGVRAVAVTRGADPVLWWRAGEGLRGEGRTGEIPVPQVTPVDTLGAGDVFHGALARAMASRPWFEQLPEVLSFAAEVAASRVEHIDRRRWIASLPGRVDLLFRE